MFKSVSGVTMTSNECTNQILTRKQKRKSGCVILGASMGSFVFRKMQRLKRRRKRKADLIPFMDWKSNMNETNSIIRRTVL